MSSCGIKYSCEIFKLSLQSYKTSLRANEINASKYSFIFIIINLLTQLRLLEWPPFWQWCAHHAPCSSSRRRIDDDGAWSLVKTQPINASHFIGHPNFHYSGSTAIVWNFPGSQPPRLCLTHPPHIPDHPLLPTTSPAPRQTPSAPACVPAYPPAPRSPMLSAETHRSEWLPFVRIA